MTFSIVARCAETGRLGVAVATASLAVGGRCPYAMSGVGAVTTQNRTHPMIGPRVLELLRDGVAAQDAVEAAATAFAFPKWRQVAVVDSKGGVGVFHGAHCSGVHAEARGAGVVALGNLLQTDAVPGAMIAAFEATVGMLEDRLLAGLAGGLAAGGEVNPLQSAALLVVDGDPFPFTNLRVDWDGAAPLETLQALWQKWRPVAGTYRTWAVDPSSV
jgi:uncharacterized Ntn-hydrolase superfamily protein